MYFNLCKIMILLLGVFCFTHSHAETKNKVNLSIKPLACIVKKTGDLCEMTVKINWHSPEPINSCLFQDQTKALCWHNSSHAQEHIKINIKANTVFTLRNDNNDIYAQQHVNINTSLPKSYRRRLRSDWSLF